MSESTIRFYSSDFAVKRSEAYLSLWLPATEARPKFAGALDWLIQLHDERAILKQKGDRGVTTFTVSHSDFFQLSKNTYFGVRGKEGFLDCVHRLGFFDVVERGRKKSAVLRASERWRKYGVVSTTYDEKPKAVVGTPLKSVLSTTYEGNISRSEYGIHTNTIRIDEEGAELPPDPLHKISSDEVRECAVDRRQSVGRLLAAVGEQIGGIS